MSDLVLYHYAMSPFSEKVRAMLGYADLPWLSVTVSEQPPRPVLRTLAGGYRKVPVAQLGADIFCDSRTIAAEIARLADKPELVLEQQPEAIQNFVHDVDQDIFMACVVAASDGRLVRKLIRETSLWNTVKFLKDRIQMGRKSRVKTTGGVEAKAKVMAYLADLESRLTDNFLFGSTPCIADFSAYHGLWFVCDLAGKPWLRDFEKVSRWMARMQAFGHGQRTELSAKEALARAKQASPRPLPAAEDNPQVGQRVSIAPTDYARDPATGKLVYSGASQCILARDLPKIGTLHLHFPKQGFRIQEA